MWFLMPEEPAQAPAWPHPAAAEWRDPADPGWGQPPTPQN
jgi:phage shock protein C